MVKGITFRNSLKMVLRLALVAGLYFILSLAGYLTTLIPGNASPIWPAAGFALGALFIWGASIWPGLWLGALAYWLWHGESVMLAALLALGPAVQALAGYWMTRRFVFVAEALQREADILRFLFRAGPLACVISASCGIVLFQQHGHFPEQQLLGQWLTWWSGETLGVLLFAPVALLFLPGAARFRTLGMTRIALPLFVAAVMIAVALAWHDRMDRSEHVDRVERGMNAVYEREIVTLPATLWGLESLAIFFAASEFVSQDEFTVFALSSLKYPGMRTLAWLPRVTAGQRADFEREQLADVGEGFISEWVNNAYLIVAPDRAEYFPALYVAPIAADFVAPGRDFSRGPAYRAAMEQARSGNLMTSVLSSHALSVGRHEIHVFLPVYRYGFDVAMASAGERRDALQGYFMAVIDLGDMLAGMVESARIKGLQLRVVDAGNEVIAFPGLKFPDNTSRWRRELDFADHKLHIEMRSAGVSWHSAGTPSERLFHGVSVLFVLLLSLVIMAAAGRSEFIAARERRFRAIFEQNGVGILQVDPATGRILLANQRLCDMLGYSAEDMVDKTWHDLTYPEDRAMDQIMAEKVSRGEIDDYGLEKRLLTAAGDTLWVSANASLVRDKAGQPLYGQLVVEDISERRVMREALEVLNTTLTGSAFFDYLAMHLSRLLKAEFAFIGQIRDLSSGRVMTRASFAHTLLWPPPKEYNVAGTPSENVIGKAYCCYPDGLQQRFPAYPMANELGFVSYAAMPLWDSHERPTGLIGIMSRHPIKQTGVVDAVLRLMALRAGAELEREEQERIVRESEQKIVRLTGSLGNKYIFYRHEAEGFNTTLLGQSDRTLLGPANSTGADYRELLTDNPINAQIPMYKEAVLRGRGVPVTYEVESWREDGSRCLMELTEIAVIGRDGRITAVEGVAHDITQRKKDAEELRQLAVQLENRVEERTHDLASANDLLSRREEEMSSLLNNLGEGVIQIDACGIMQLANPAVERILGYRPEALVGHNVSMLMPEPDKSAHNSYLARYLSSNQSHVLGSTPREVVGLHRDGRLIELDLVVNEYRVRDELHFTGILRDITQRKLALAELELARNEAEAANRAKSAFLATMSHEIRTPMNGVIGTLDVLRRASLKPYQAELADIISDSAMSLLTIIDDILDFSKIEAGKLELEHEPLLLMHAVEGACDALQPIAMRKQVSLTTYIDPLLPDWVFGDGVRLRQIISNLLGNAIKFSARQGRQGQVKVRVEASGPDRMRFTIADNGIGITPEALGKLFTPFTQAETSTTRRFGGTGLGLTICRRLVDLMGGKMAVDSTPGEGSTFIVTLPLEAVTAHPLRAPAHDLHGLDCTIVAWDAAQGQDWASYLAHAGARVSHWPDWETARQQLPATFAAHGVLLLEIPLDSVKAAGMRARLNAQPDMGIVVIAKGRRRQPRMEEGIVFLDGDAMHRASLIQAVAMAAGRAELVNEEAAEDAAEAGAIVPPSVEEAATQGRLILVAEDNDINQKVILRQLALLGYVAEIAEDGRKALVRWRQGKYALLLTDLHMPEMDGYELTAAIRREENGGKRLPIVALTANALKGEDLICIEAGMDDYLSKPVQIDRLQAMLEKWMPAGAASAAMDLPNTALQEGPAPAGTNDAGGDMTTNLQAFAAKAAPTAVLDTAVLARLVGDDPGMIAEFLDDYRLSAQHSAEEIRNALNRQDWKSAGAAAHKLKSSSRAVGALVLGDVCARLELAGKNDDAGTVQLLAPEFENALAAAMAALDQK